MKHKIIFCIATTLAFTANVYSQNAKPVAEPAITQAVINTPANLPTQINAPTHSSFTKPNIDMQLKTAKPLDMPTTIDTKRDDSKYYKSNENLKPKPTAIPKDEVNKPINQQSKPSAKTTE